MMWDDKLPATLPVMTDFVDHAKEIFEGWGYPVEVVPSIKTAKSITEQVYVKPRVYLERELVNLMGYQRLQGAFVNLRK